MKKSGQAGVKVQADGLTGRASLKKNGQAGAKAKASGSTRGAPLISTHYFMVCRP